MSIDPEFLRLYERDSSAVFRSVLLLAGDRELAEDATQEAFARALVRWRRLRSHPSPGGWVMTTALNVARRALRRHPQPVDGGPDRIDEPAVELLDLREAIRELPQRQLEAVALHYLLDLPVADTAAVMGVDEGTVKTHLSRARAALARALHDSEPDNDDVRS